VAVILPTTMETSTMRNLKSIILAVLLLGMLVAIYPYKTIIWDYSPTGMAVNKIVEYVPAEWTDKLEVFYPEKQPAGTAS